MGILVALAAPWLPKEKKNARDDTTLQDTLRISEVGKHNVNRCK